MPRRPTGRPQPGETPPVSRLRQGSSGRKTKATVGPPSRGPRIGGRPADRGRCRPEPPRPSWPPGPRTARRPSDRGPSRGRGSYPRGCVRERWVPGRTAAPVPGQRSSRTERGRRDAPGPVRGLGPTGANPTRTRSPRPLEEHRPRRAARRGNRSRGDLLTHRSQGLFVPLLHPIVFRAGPNERLAESLQGGPPWLRLAQRPDLHHHVFEGPSLVEVAQDEVQLADDELEHVDLAVEEFHQVRLHGLLRPQVRDVDLALLAEAVHPSDPLFDAQGIPREIVVDDRPRELQVPALSAGLRAQEHLSVPLERPHRAIFRRGREAAMVDRDTMALAFEDALQMLQRPEVLGEHEGLFVRRAEELDQPCGLTFCWIARASLSNASSWSRSRGPKSGLWPNRLNVSAAA